MIWHLHDHIIQFPRACIGGGHSIKSGPVSILAAKSWHEDSGEGEIDRQVASSSSSLIGYI